VDEFQKAAFDWIVMIRGGLPEKCDFCLQVFTEERYPIPEEGGEWTCRECLTRWEAKGG